MSIHNTVYKDAPADGTEYVRKDGAWTLNTGGSGSYWTASGDDIYRATGSVGIGVAPPLGSLFVNTDASESNAFYVSRNTSGSQSIRMWSDASAHFMKAKGTKTFVIEVETGGYDLSMRAAQAVSFFTAGTQRVRLNSAGDVAIGTTVPDNAKLHVAGGTINLDNGYYVSWGGGTSRPSIGGDKTSGYLRFITAGSEQMRIDSAGGVGIGTTSPQDRLVVKGVNRELRVGKGASDNHMEIRSCNSAGSDAYLDMQCYQLAIYTGGTYRLTIGNGGEIKMIGLPTTDPGVANQLWNDSGTLKISSGT